MKPKQEPEFSWPVLFIVTAVCFLAFSGIIKIINGSPSHSALFLKISAASLVMFFFSLIAGTLSKSL